MYWSKLWGRRASNDSTGGDLSIDKDSEEDRDHSSMLYLNGVELGLWGGGLDFRIENIETKKSLGESVHTCAVVTASDKVTQASGTFNGDAGGISLLYCCEDL